MWYYHVRVIVSLRSDLALTAISIIIRVIFINTILIFIFTYSLFIIQINHNLFLHQPHPYPISHHHYLSYQWVINILQCVNYWSLWGHLNLSVLINLVSFEHGSFYLMLFMYHDLYQHVHDAYHLIFDQYQIGSSQVQIVLFTLPSILSSWRSDTAPPLYQWLFYKGIINHSSISNTK